VHPHFVVVFETISGFIIFKEGKKIDPKKIKALAKMPIPKWQNT
jgi:hypothetical protein